MSKLLAAASVPNGKPATYFLVAFERLKSLPESYDRQTDKRDGHYFITSILCSAVEDLRLPKFFSLSPSLYVTTTVLILFNFRTC
jgi:hypothetical protein